MFGGELNVEGNLIGGKFVAKEEGGDVPGGAHYSFK